MKHHLIAACACAVVLAAGDAAAQSDAWGDNGFVSFNGVYQSSSTTFRTTSTIDKNHEQGELSTTHSILPGPVYDISAGGRIKGNLGIGYAASYFRRTEVAEISGGVPHPFYFNQPRAISGQSNLRREDLAIHLDAMWLIPVTESFQVALFGGPTYFRVTQHMVQDVEISEEYPFDEVHLTGATSTREHASKIGMNGGVDLSWFFSEHVGVAGIVRYSRAIVSMPSPGGSSTSIETGGLQNGAGIRVRF
jgi:hypothetical protein